jgi:hypothetical protein
MPRVTLVYSPAGPAFSITEDCAMPTIKVTANLVDVTPDPKVPLSYQWNVTLIFVGGACVHSVNRRISHPEINATTQTNTFTIPFSQVRGGDLTVSVSVRVGNVVLAARSEKLQVVGTNPSTGALLNMLITNDAFKKLMRLESGLRQFRTPSCPLFSGDNLGGVGICQITSPRPTDDQVWSWKENLNAGLLFYKAKEGVARAYPRHVRESQAFRTLVKDYNDKRVANGRPEAPLRPLTIDLPDYTPEQLERDTVRGYNGYAAGLHEYRPKVDGAGLLVVKVDAGGSKGTAEWEVISAADRVDEYDKRNIPANHRGDPGYVDDVYNQASF